MKRLLVAVLIVCAIVSCAKQEESKVLVTMEGDKITLDEFTKSLDKIPMNMKMLVATQSGKKNYLDSLIVKRLLLREAKKDNVENEKEFQDRLTDIREQLLIEALLKKKIAVSTQSTEEELKKYYDANKEQFKKDRELNTRHILLKTADEAKQIQSRLSKGEDFAELAKQYSIDPNAKTTGGELGFHPKGTLLPEYEAAAFKLQKPGQVSPVVKTQFGYHIIRLEGAKEASYVPFAEVKDFIKQKVGQDKQKEVLEKYIDELRKSAKITINEDLLKDEKAPAAGAPEKVSPKADQPEGAAKTEEAKPKK